MRVSNYIKNNESGQTLVVVVFVMIIALAIGMTISTRFTTTLRQTTESDISPRALATAEALVERILIIPNTTLDDYITFDTCGTNCRLEITGEDGVTAVATAELSRLGNSTDPFFTSITPNNVVEVSLSGYPNNTDVDICWNSGAVPSVYASYIYGVSGSFEMEAYAYNSVGSVQTNGFTEAAPSGGYDNCFTVDGESNPVAMRLKSLYSAVDVYVIPTGGSSLPSQGILIDASGTILDITRSVSVIKSEPYLPMQFDYVLYQKTVAEPLSN